MGGGGWGGGGGGWVVDGVWVRGVGDGGFGVGRCGGREGVVANGAPGGAGGVGLVLMPGVARWRGGEAVRRARLPCGARQTG